MTDKKKKRSPIQGERRKRGRDSGMSARSAGGREEETRCYWSALGLAGRGRVDLQQSTAAGVGAAGSAPGHQLRLPVDLTVEDDLHGRVRVEARRASVASAQPGRSRVSFRHVESEAADAGRQSRQIHDERSGRRACALVPPAAQIRLVIVHLDVERPGDAIRVGDLDLGRGGAARRRNGTPFVDHAVAVVVLAIAANLGRARLHRGVLVVAVHLSLHRAEAVLVVVDAGAAGCAGRTALVDVSVTVVVLAVALLGRPGVDVDVVVVAVLACDDSVSVVVDSAGGLSGLEGRADVGLGAGVGGTDGIALEIDLERTAACGECEGEDEGNGGDAELHGLSPLADGYTNRPPNPPWVRVRGNCRKRDLKGRELVDVFSQG